ncbi:MAG: DoxX family protein [Acidobacteriota bacterium]
MVGVAFLYRGGGENAEMDASWAAAYTQVAAGALLLLGLATPVAALAISVTMTFATLSQITQGEPFISLHGRGYESALLYVLAGIVLTTFGPGRFSLDGVLCRRWTPRTEPERVPHVVIPNDPDLAAQAHLEAMREANERNLSIFRRK